MGVHNRRRAALEKI